MTLRFVEPLVPNAWLAESPVSLDALRAETLDPKLPQSFREGYCQTLDEIELLLDTGDAMFRFSSPPETWTAKCGVSGVAIIRDGNTRLCIELACN